MSTTSWRRAAVGACTATALVVGAGLAFAPAADAAAPSTGLLGGVATGVTGIVGGVLGGVTTTGTTATTSPTSLVTVTSSPGGVAVGVGSTTVGVTTGNGVGVTVGTGNGAGVGVTLGGTSTGAGGTATVSGGSGTPDPSGTTSPSPSPTATGTPAPSSATPVLLTALSVTPQYPTVFPAKDGYRDTDAFTLHGTTSDGLQHVASGTATLTLGSSTVATWPITATDQVITWNGLRSGRIVPGRYTFTATIGDASGQSVSGVARVDVSAKKLTSATSRLTAKSVSGTHRMSPTALEGLSKGKVTLRITAIASHVRGKQYLVFTHKGKHLRVLIRNGKHTSKAVTVPRSFTSFTISHTWKKNTVKIRSLQYRYSFKALK